MIIFLAHPLHTQTHMRAHTHRHTHTRTHTHRPLVCSGQLSLLTLLHFRGVTHRRKCNPCLPNSLSLCLSFHSLSLPHTRNTTRPDTHTQVHTHTHTYTHTYTQRHTPLVWPSEMFGWDLAATERKTCSTHHIRKRQQHVARNLHGAGREFTFHCSLSLSLSLSLFLYLFSLLLWSQAKKKRGENTPTLMSHAQIHTHTHRHSHTQTQTYSHSHTCL